MGCAFLLVSVSIILMAIFGHMEVADSGHGHRRLGGGHSSDDNHSEHQHSAVPHSVTGRVTYSFMAFQMALGLFRPGKESEHRKMWYLAHRTVAVATFLLVLYQIISAFFQTSI